MIRPVLALLAASAVLPAAAAPLELSRGVGVHEWLNWAPLDETGNYRWPPYETREEWLTRSRPLSDWPEGDQLARIRGFGFDFVRLTVDPGPLLASTGEQRQQALDVVASVVDQFVSADLKVVFNFHPNSQIPQYGPAGIEGTPDSTVIADYLSVVVDATDMLLQFGNDAVAMEPFNEPAYYPCDTTGSDDWQAILEQQVAAIRTVTAEMTIVVTGACGGGVEGLVDVNATTFDDPNILYSFHMYRPHSFTHQRLEGGWASGLPWPAAAVAPEMVRQTLDAAMEAAGLNALDRQINWMRIAGEVDAYYAEQQGEAQLEGLFTQALDWANANGIPATRLFMGEFGVVARSADGREGAFDSDRRRYIEAARKLAEANGIPWAIWEYSNPAGMSFILPQGPAVPDPVLVEALGLPTAH